MNSPSDRPKLAGILNDLLAIGMRWRGSFLQDVALEFGQSGSWQKSRM
jgi:hypothetical protein